MDKGAIKNFSVNARNKLIAAVTQRAFELGITETNIVAPEKYEDGFQLNGIFFRQEEIEQREHLIKKIYQTSFAFVIEEVAYTWFNRFIAIRFMEVNDYLPTGIRMFSSIEQGKTEPDVMTEIDLLIDDLQLDRNYIYELQDDNNDDELFKYVLIKQCNELGAMMPLVFEEITGYTALLLPDYLLTENSVVRDLVTMIDEQDWLNEVEIIGWLYQYYNAEKKDEVFANLRKNIKINKENIPAATQLFTPRWIVQYMIDNSLGRLWIESHQESTLQGQLPYFLEDTQEDDVVKKIEEMTEKNINPESITFLDPSMGSGHVLIYAFDVLYHIYISQGYRERDIPKLIIENNLYGLEIDARATQLAYFALMMKARQYNPRIFSETIKTNIVTVEESNSMTDEDVNLFVDENESLRESLNLLIDIFHDAKLYGSILKIPEVNFENLNERVQELQQSTEQDLFLLDFKQYSLPKIEHLIKQAQLLNTKYDIVVTNPPYMGRRGMNPELVKYVRKHYKDSSADLFAVFMETASKFVRSNGFIGMINQHAWMFLSSYEKLRKKTLANHQIYSMAHLGTRAFEEIGGEVVQTTSFVMRKKVIPNFLGTYVRLTDVNNAEEKSKEFFNEELHFERTQDGFTDIPGSPVAYWVSPSHHHVFKSSILLGDLAEIRKGLATGNTEYFIKHWYEVLFNKISFNKENKLKKWFPCHKGGDYRKWYGNFEKIINWENDGFEIRNYRDESGKLRSRPQNLHYMFKSGIVFSKITSSGSSCRLMLGDEMFDDAVQGLFLINQNVTIEYLVALLNSPIIAEFLNILNPTLNKQINDLERIPILIIDKMSEFTNNIEGIIELYKSDWDSFETSWDFKEHPFIEFKNGATKIEEAFNNWKKEAADRFQTLKANEEELNRIFIDLYGLQDELTPDVADEDVTVSRADVERDVKSFLSYLVGIMFGRYSLDEQGLIFAGGEFEMDRYKTFKPDNDNIIPITDDMYFEDDIVSRTIELIKLIFGADHVEENLEFIADILTRRRNETARERIRRYFLREFDKDHDRTYQKRPIYWLINSGRQNGFKALIYLHRYQTDLLSRVRTQYLHPQIKKYEDEIKRLELTMQADVSQAEKTRARKRREKIDKQIIECQNYDQIIAYMANQQIELDLDDGVKVNYDKFQEITVPQGEGKKPIKTNVFARL